MAEHAASAADETAAGPSDDGPPSDLTAAAFFDVDNTLVQGSSLVHFGRGLAARKYFTYGDLRRFIFAQAKFQLTGRENSDDVAEGRRKALAFIEADPPRNWWVSAREIYDEIIADKIWPGTRALAQMHLDAGQQVWLVTATPFELAETIAKRLASPARSAPSPNPSTASSPDDWSARSCTVPAKLTRCVHSPSARA